MSLVCHSNARNPSRLLIVGEFIPLLLSLCVILYGRLCVFVSVIVIDVSVVITVVALNHYQFGTHNINSLSSF